MSHREKWTLAGIGLLIVLGIVGYAVAIFVRADRIIAKHTQEVREGLEALASRVAERPALAEWPLDRPASERPADARPIYERALLDLRGTREEDGDTDVELGICAHQVHEGEDLQAFLDDHAVQIDALQEVRYADRISFDPDSFDPDILLEMDRGREYFQPKDWMDLGSLLQSATRHAFAADDYHRAARLIELRLCLGRDYARTGVVLHHLAGGHIFEAAARDARHLLATGALDASELRAFATLQDRVGRNLRSPGVAWKADSLALRDMILRMLENPAVDPLELSAEADLRHLFSTRVWLAEALERLPPWIDKLPPLDGVLPHEAWVRSRTIRDEALATNHKLLRMTLIMAPHSYSAHAEVETHAHLLRVSTALAAYRADEGAWPARLEDLVPAYLEQIAPCPATGLPLGYADGKVWSQGGDLDDDGGRPIDEDGDWRSEGDVVWDLTDKAVPPLEDD